MGFDAIGSGHHPSFAQALETSMVCEIPFETLDDYLPLNAESASADDASDER